MFCINVEETLDKAKPPLSIESYLKFYDSVVAAASSLKRQDHDKDCLVYHGISDQCLWPLVVCVPSNYTSPIPITLVTVNK